MKKVLTNFFMDILLFLALMSQIFTGILLHRFPSELADTTVLGLTRYTWGTIHWLVCILFVLIIITHLILHWAWVKATALKYIRMRSKVLLATTIVALLFAFFMPYYITRDLPDRSDFSASYQKTTYEESILIKNELGGISSEPHSISGPWRKRPSLSEEPQSDNN